MAQIRHIDLMAIEESDLPFIQAWRNSDPVMRNCRQYRPLSLTDMKKWYANLNKESDYNLTNDFFIMNLVEPLHFDRKIGVCGLTRIDWRNRKAEVSFYIGNSEDNDKENITMGLSGLLAYTFETLQLHKVYFPVYSFNPNLPIYEGIMKKEYVAKEEYYWRKKYYDRIILVAYGHI